jgi:hypothetical protein
VTGAGSSRDRWAQSFLDDTGNSFAAIVDPDISLEGSIFSRPIAGRGQVWTALRTAAGEKLSRPVDQDLFVTAGSWVPGRSVSPAASVRARHDRAR